MKNSSEELHRSTIPKAPKTTITSPITTETIIASTTTTITQFGTVIDDWNTPFSNEEMEAIEAAFEAATEASRTPSSSLKTPRSSSSVSADDIDTRPTTRRRLPGSISSSDGEVGKSYNPGPFALTPCSRNWNFRQGNVKMKYPALNFGGRIVYSRTNEEVEEAALQILKLLEARQCETGRAALGLDIEWKPSFDRDIPQGKAAVMQICGDMADCYVLHIIHSGIPGCLQSLLENPNFIKLLKPKKIRLGNWETDFLSKAQLQYAATDAFASWLLYEVLKSFPDLPDNQEN